MASDADADASLSVVSSPMEDLILSQKPAAAVDLAESLVWTGGELENVLAGGWSSF